MINQLNDQPLGTPIFKPRKGQKSDKNDPPLLEGWLRAWTQYHEECWQARKWHH